MNDRVQQLIYELGSLPSRYSRAYGENGDRVADLLTTDAYRISQYLKDALAEHDRQQRAQGWDASADHAAYALRLEDYDLEVLKADNPYRGGEQS